MQDRLPSLPEDDVAVLAKLVTIGQIVDHLAGLLQGTVPPLPADEQQPTSIARDDRTSATRFVVRATHAPRAGTRTVAPADGRVAVTDDGAGVGAALVDLLVADGISAELVTEAPVGYDCVIFLGGLRRARTVDDAVAVNGEAFRVARASNSSSRVFVTVTDLGGAFGDGGVDEIQAWTAGITGLARTAAIEWPSTRVKAIDVERDGQRPHEVAQLLADELRNGGPELEVGLRVDGSRLVLQNEPADVVAGPLVLGPTDVVVVSGGARGITATSIVELARATRARFVLLGRSSIVDEPPECRDGGRRSVAQARPARHRDRERTAHQPGRARCTGRARSSPAGRSTTRSDASPPRAARPGTVAVDITDASAVERGTRPWRAPRGDRSPPSSTAPACWPIDGSSTRPTNSSTAVFDTKVIGLRVLLDATADDPLKLLCMFSSVAARAGNDGQSDYAMANEVLNKVAVAERARRGAGCVVKSFRWGPWAGGMVTPALPGPLRVDGCRGDRSRRRRSDVRRRARQPAARPRRGDPRQLDIACRRRRPAAPRRAGDGTVRRRSRSSVGHACFPARCRRTSCGRRWRPVTT